MERKLVVGPFTLKIDSKTWDRLLKYEFVKECEGCKDGVYHPRDLALTLIAVAGVEGQDTDTVCRTLYHRLDEHKEGDGPHDVAPVDDLDNLFD